MSGSRTTQTLAPTGAGGVAPAPLRAGLVVAFERDAARRRVYGVDGSIEIGRGSECSVVVDDDSVSRVHARVRVRGGLWFVDDLGSRNGTFVDGRRIEAPWRGTPRVIRVGATLVACVPELGELRESDLSEPDPQAVVGVALRRAWQRIEAAARAGVGTLVQGESGAGKELAARRFHQRGPRPDGPFVAVNCATIPAALAESVLFGARRGAFSGAVSDTEGLVRAADGGTLFLDEIGDLPLAVQAKLLRTLETGEVLPLGATRPHHVRFSLVSATHRDLRAAVERGEFRADLLFRLAASVVVVPSLHQRCEEIPWHVQHELACHDGVTASASFVEACMLRRWPGNVRELRAEVRRAATDARLRGTLRLGAADLAPESLAPSGETSGVRPDPLDDTARVLDTLRRHGGNVSASARELGVHRTQLRRWLQRRGDASPDADEP